jgi:TctA family transporter
VESLLAATQEPFQAALQQVLSPRVLGVMLVAAGCGIVIGAMPGLTATMAVALVVPFTFFLDDIPAIAAIVTLVTCSIFAGDIPATLVRIPGTPASAAYADDAYALMRSGRHGVALRTSLLASVLGGLFGAIVLIAAAPQLARVAFLFTTYEYFWLVVLGLSCAALISRTSPLAGAISLLLGLLFSTVGLSEVHAAARFTFDQDEMIGGISFIPAMIGLFGGSEVLRNVARGRVDAPPSSSHEPTAQTGPTRAETVAADEEPPWRFICRRPWHALRSSSIGTAVGMLPGAGADIAAWISYAVSKRFARHPERFGLGSREGLADASGANNASLAGAWIPALVFGIPGDSVTAIVIGVLLMKNITPGPEIFTDPARATLVWGVYAVFLLANVLLLPVGLLAIRASSLLLRIRRSLLFPAIVLVSIVGAYAINGSYFDVGVMLAMSVLGFVLEAFGVPLGPLVLGIILGGRLEQTFIQNLAKSDSLWDFFARPLAGTLGAICLLLWLAPVLLGRWRALRRRGVNDGT